MVIAERLARLAVRAFPQTERAEHGDELVGTACELGADSRTRLVHELLYLVAAGLGARSRQVADLTTGSIVHDGLRLGIQWIVTLSIGTQIRALIYRPGRFAVQGNISMLTLACLASVLVLLLWRLDRAAGALGLIWICHLSFTRLWTGMTMVAVLYLYGAFLVGFLALLRRPRARGFRRSRLFWLLVPALMCASLCLPVEGGGTVADLYWWYLVPLALVLTVVVALPFAPRVVVAVGLLLGTWWLPFRPLLVEQFLQHLPLPQLPLGPLGVVVLFLAPPVLLVLLAARRLRRVQTRPDHLSRI